MSKLNIKLKGRLGNQLYQIMTGLSYAINNNIDFDNIYITNYKNSIYYSNIFESGALYWAEETVLSQSDESTRRRGGLPPWWCDDKSCRGD